MTKCFSVIIVSWKGAEKCETLDFCTVAVIVLVCNVVDPDPQGSETFDLIWNYF
jgi:hypothetical protein